MNFLKKNIKTFKEGFYIGLVVGIAVAIAVIIKESHWAF
jgi:hypothetical protein